MFLSMSAAASASPAPLDQIDPMRRPIEGAFAANDKLSQGGFVVLKRSIAQVRSFELAYSHSAEARRVAGGSMS